ncbi:MAG: hypothetical protein ACQEP8_06275 [Chlamydiota bacterium]
MIAKKIESHPQYWAIIGPLTLSLTVILAVVKVFPGSAYLAFVAAAALPACWLAKKRGAVAITLLMVGGLLIIYAGDYKLWQMVVMVSMALGIGVSYFSFEEADKIIDDRQEASQNFFKKFLAADSQLKDVRKKSQEEREGLDRQLAEYQQEVEDLKEQLNAQQKMVIIANDKNQELNVRNNKLTEENLQLLRANAYLRTQQEKAANVKPDIYEGRYKQLRHQFEEKSAVLDSTRVDLFEAQGKIAVLEKEKAFAYQEQQDSVRLLQEELSSFEQEINQWESEALLLNDLVSALMRQLAQRSG